VKIYKDSPILKTKMIYAAWWMAKTRNISNGYKVNSRTYAMLRDQFIKNSPNKCEERKKRWKENYYSGKYNYDNAKVSSGLKKYLSGLSQEEMSTRMKNSFLKCDQKERGISIKKGKGSLFKLIRPNGEIIKFWSYDNIDKITGYSYSHIKYRLKYYDGVLDDGSKVSFLKRYNGNDKRIGRKRNNSI
jgi:hypothetical protein